MLLLNVYIEDDRYSVPTLQFLSVGNLTQAKAAAERLMMQSPHHRGVEMRLEDERLLGIGSYSGGLADQEAERRDPGPSLAVAGGD